MSMTALMWTAVAILDVVAATRAIYRAQGVEHTLAWVFAILALPGVGGLAYLALTGPTVRRTTHRRRRSIESYRSRIAALGGDLVPPLSPDDVPEDPMLAVAAEVTQVLPSAGNEVQMLAEDVRAFEEIEAALWAAQRSVWAEYYLIRNDQTGHRFLDLLVERAKAGLEVRLLCDAVGSMGLDARRLKALVAAGGRAESFMPMNPLRRRWSFDLRNHRKLVIVDGEQAFTGGMNVGDEYSGRSHRQGATHFHDTHLSLRGPVVADLARIFAEDWCFATDESLALPARPSPLRTASALVAVVPSGPDQQYNANGMVYFAGIASARERVYLATPYFIPDEPTVWALISAALRGVDVRLLLPGLCDLAVVRAAARTYYPLLLDAGVRVFEYQPSMLHAKTMAVDGRDAIIGSANVDIRSFRRNFELGALVADPVFVAAVEPRFLADLGQSVEITEDMIEGAGFWSKIRDRTARLLSPLL